MRIGFVGKGGSGKTTLSALFAQFCAERVTTTIIDADLNVHVPAVPGLRPDQQPPSLSSPAAAAAIRRALIGSNDRIPDIAAFTKATPPGAGATIVDFSAPATGPLTPYLVEVGPNLHLATVGSYEADEVGRACYHNNLSILENILSHSVTGEAMLIIDMVAGVDAFASTLHAQLDAIVVVVEPTGKSVATYAQYAELAAPAGVLDRLICVANKVEDAADLEFLSQELGTTPIGWLGRSDHVRAVDKGRCALSVRDLEPDGRDVLERIHHQARSLERSDDERLRHLWRLHERYVDQGYVRALHGDLSHQRDSRFAYPSPADVSIS